MGMGDLGLADVIFKRKFRWTFSIQTACNNYTVPASIVKLAARPNLTIEETEINYLHGKMWIPGKGAWETITVTYYDIAGLGNAAQALGKLFSWLATVYNFTDPVCLSMSSKTGGPNVPGYSGIGTLILYDGCGKGLEKWTMKNMWPQAINFGELDYSSSEECTVELTLRFSEVKYEPLNGCSGAINPCCDGC
jgi:hypothetical protein